jgi:hypothetical protein
LGGAFGGLLPPFGDSMAEACIAYAYSVCARTTECSQGTDFASCLLSTGDCPDLVASPGSTRTPETLRQCAAAYVTLPCDQVIAGTLPSCVTPGTRAQGESCVYHSQCSTLNCKADAECGICSRTVAVGESCVDPTVDCGSEAACVEGTCRSNDRPEPAGPNEPCAEGGCIGNYYCDNGVAGSGLCVRLPDVGETCSIGRGCRVGARCDGTSGSCVALPALGESCGLDNGDGRGFYCTQGVCAGADQQLGQPGTCVAIPSLDQACVKDPLSFPPGFSLCEDGLACDQSLQPPLCKPPLKAGSACKSIRDCEAGLACRCPENQPECTTRTCTRYLYGGAACDAASLTARCNSAFDCKAGVCQPAELRGVFQKACGD